MTLKRNDGRWSMTKVGIFCSIAASVATCIIAAPIAIDYCKSAIAPWASVPTELKAMRNDITEIKQKLDVRTSYNTNRTVQLTQYQAPEDK